MKQLFSILILVSATASGCGGDTEEDAPAGVEQLCTPNESACFGNIAATCAEDGKSYNTNTCGENQLCQSNGSCKDVDCQPGHTICFSAKELNTCSPVGSWNKSDCGSDMCVAGGCRPTPCTDAVDSGSTVCAGGNTATCGDDGIWSDATECGANEVCSDGACAPKECQPSKHRCLDEMTPQVCNEDGTAWLDPTACPANEECYQELGVCLPKLLEPAAIVDEPESTDTVEEEPDDGPPPVEDTGPKAELEPLDVAVCSIDGVEIKFTSNLSATYVETDKDLRVSMDKGLQKIEVSIKPIEPLDIADFSSTEAEDTQITILYNDGSDIGGAQWKYQSVEYELELSKFQDVGGRVKGNFSGQLTPDGGKTMIPLTDCTFDVKRHD